MKRVNTVTGERGVEDLGPTLMHEHLAIGLAGWETDSAHPGPSFREAVAICSDRVSELRSYGIASFVDPCPSDLGRDVRLMAEVSGRTGLNVIAATGLYHEQGGGSNAYWRFRAHMAEHAGQSIAPYMAEMFIRELTYGIGDTGIKAGVIKVATGSGAITAYEKEVIHAAAIASLATGTPITTHTENGVMGREQQALLLSQGVAPHRIIIGHSCGTSDQDYHSTIATKGSYLGFDRFGYEDMGPGMAPHSDDARITALLRLVAQGAGDRIVISCDSICTMWGRLGAGCEWVEGLLAPGRLLHSVRDILPRMRARGLAEAQVQSLLRDNPFRYFADQALPVLTSPVCERSLALN